MNARQIEMFPARVFDVQVRVILDFTKRSQSLLCEFILIIDQTRRLKRLSKRLAMTGYTEQAFDMVKRVRIKYFQLLVLGRYHMYLSAQASEMYGRSEC